MKRTITQSIVSNFQQSTRSPKQSTNSRNTSKPNTTSPTTNHHNNNYLSASQSPPSKLPTTACSIAIWTRSSCKTTPTIMLSTLTTTLRIITVGKCSKIPQGKIRVIVNQKNVGALYSIYLAVTDYCAADEIVVLVDGDDSLLGRQVLSLLNAVFQKEKLLLLYSQYYKIT